MPTLFTRRSFLASTGASLAFHRLPSRLCFGHLHAGPDVDASEINASEVAKFRKDLKGRIIIPTDGDYDLARRVVSFNPLSDKHPQMIVRCAELDDVIRAVIFAREKGLDVAVRSGGHDLLGASVCDGMVIDLSPMKKMNLDREQRAARVEAGVRAWELNAFTGQAGLAAALGCFPGVGVAGLTLGGGLGWLLGKHGAACDNLVGADVITANGKLLRATATENADLFWAVRGGGGNFGIMTALDLSLHTVDKVLAGVTAYRADVGQFLRFYRDSMKNAPDELAVEVSIYVAKQPTIMALVCWSGDTTVGMGVLESLKSFGPPIADSIDLVPYAQMGSRFAIIGQLISSGAPQSQQPRPPRQDNGPVYSYWRGGSLNELSNAAIQRLAAATNNASVGSSIGLGHYMHGQICRVEQQATPLMREMGQITYFFNAGWLDPEKAEVEMNWVNQSIASMLPFSSKGTYINYLSSDSAAAVKASYAKSYDRLAEIKRKYDPTNFFHHNRNIHPAIQS